MSDGKQQSLDENVLLQDGHEIGPNIASSCNDLTDPEKQSLEDEGLLRDGVYIDNEGDMPRPDGIVFETLKRPEVSNMVKKGISERFVDPVAWPERGTLPQKEFLAGWFRKAFPRLFPYGRADWTCARIGQKVSFSHGVQHLLKVDRRHAKDPLFVMVVTNIP